MNKKGSSLVEAALRARRKAGTLFLAGALFLSIGMDGLAGEEAQLFDRYAVDPHEDGIQTMAMEYTEELSANIRKRVEWTDKENGDAKVTLQYQSNSGSITGTKDMNIILIQDKSGSMDSNFGFKVQLEKEGLSVNDHESVSYFPNANEMGWAESAEDLVQDVNYVDNLNRAENGLFGTKIYNSEMLYNSPCQVENHYYLLVKDDSVAGAAKGSFIHGNNLYHISGTDLHHYIKLESREEALTYLSQGRRVIKGKVYYGEDGRKQESEEYFYFLDNSKSVVFLGKTYLCTVDTECEQNDRLWKSQEFMKCLVDDIQHLNANNQIAYIPFWGDVPENGAWENLSSKGSLTELYEDDFALQLKEKSGVTNIGFTKSDQFDTILEQIQNPFTYNGTNWSRALGKAIEFLKGRDEEEKKKQTLVIFLTDGMPQGTAGMQTDINHPLINGEAQIQELKTIDGVSLYAVGVCINQNDTDTIQRLDNANSGGKAFLARTTGDFSKLTEDIEKRIREQYEITINGLDTFYTDKLEAPFALDETKLDGTWEILNAPSVSEKKGVPENVYNAVSDSDTVKAVYIKSTKTVYWHIGTMTDGSYTEEGHQLSFPVKYADYSISTQGQDKLLRANSVQKLTYYSSANTEKMLTVSLESPQLIFQRQAAPILVITKNIEGKNLAEAHTYRFAVCKEKQNSEIHSPVKIAEVQIQAGMSSGQITVEDLPAGAYYVYEIDEQNKIQADGQTVQVLEGAGNEMNQILLTQTAELSTLEKGDQIPASFVSSDGDESSNYNNYLKISTTSASITFTQQRRTGNLQIIKSIDGQNDTVWWEHGNPTFIVRISGAGLDGKNYTFYHTYEFTKTYVEQHRAVDGKCSLSYTFEDIPLSKEYRIEEIRLSRYHLNSIQGNGENVFVRENNMSQTEECYPLYADVDLQSRPEGTVVEFYNTKSNYQWDSHTARAENKVTVP